MYIPPNVKVSLSKQKLTNEMGLVSNIKSKVVQKHKKTALKSALQQLNQLKEPRISYRGLSLLSGIIENTCEGYKGSIIIEPEQIIAKADYKCGKYFYLEPILNMFKREIIKHIVANRKKCVKKYM